MTQTNAYPKLAAADPASFAFPAWPTKAARLQWFRDALGASDAWAAWALETVYKYQTEAEKAVDQTAEDNGVGFTGTDGEILSSFAKQYAAKGSLSPKQVALLRKRAPKYAAQLVRHLEAAGVALPVVKGAEAPTPLVPATAPAEAPAAPAAAAPAPADAPSPLFAAAAVATAPTPAPAAAKPAAPAAPVAPDWAVYRNVMTLGAKFNSPAGLPSDADAFLALGDGLAPKADSFARDVWATVKAKGFCTEKQAKVLAIAFAKASAAAKAAGASA